MARRSLAKLLATCLNSARLLASAGLAGALLAAGGTAHASDNLRFTSGVTLSWDGSCSDPDWTRFAVDVLIDTTTADVTTDVFGTLYIQDFFIFYLVDGNNTILDHQGYGPIHPTTNSAHTALLWTSVNPTTGPFRYVFRDETDGTPDLPRGSTYDQASDTLLLGQIAFDAQALDPDCPAGAPTRVSQIIRDTPDVSPTNADTLTWAISFNTGVTNVSADDFTISGTTATLGVIQDHAQSYRITASGGDLASVNGTVTLGFAAGQNIQSTGGIALADTSVTGANQPTYVLDNTAPTVSISGPAGPVQGAFTATITFSEAVAGFASNELTLTNATLGSFSGSGTTYTASISPSGEGTVSIDVAGGVATDSVGNGNTAATQFSVTADSTAPLVASIERQTPATSPTNANSVTWRILFAETVVNVDTADFSVAGTTGTVTNVTNSSGNFWDVTVSGGDMGGLDGTITLNFAGGQNIEDAAGNALTITTPYGIFQNTYVLDISAPFITAFARNTPASSTTNADTLVWDITFNEAVTNVSADDFTILGTTATGVLAGSGAAHTLTVSGGDLAGLAGSLVRLNLAGGQNITDTAGNALPDAEPATDESWQVDNTAPVLSEVRRETPASETTDADTLVFRLVFNSNMNGVAADDFTVSGTTATAAITGGSDGDAIYFVTLSGGNLATINGTVGLALSGSADATDTAGNTISQQAPDTVQTYTLANDAVPPRIASIVRQVPVSSPTSADSLTWRVTFDEAVQARTAAMFSVTGTTGTIGIADQSSTVTDVTVSGGDLAGLNGLVSLGISPPALTNTDNVTDSDDAGQAISSPFSMARITINSVDYLFVGGGGFTDPEQGISVYTLDGSGAATFRSSVRDADDPNYYLRGVYGLAVAAIEGNYYLYAIGRFDGGLSVFQIDETDGSLTNIQNVNSTTHPGSYFATPNDIGYADLGGGNRVLVVTTADSAGVTTWRVASNGLVVLGMNLADDASMLLDGPQAYTAALAGGLPYAVFGSRDERGLSVFALGLDGSLTHADNVADSEAADLRLGSIQAMDTEIINGTVYIYVTSTEIPLIGEAGGVSVFTIAPGGTLTNVFNTGSPVSGAVNDLNAFYFGGRYYVAVAISSSVVLYHAAADGSLALADVINNSDDAGFRFGGASEVGYFDIGADTYLAFAGSTSDGFSLFRLGAGPVPSDISGNAMTQFTPTGTHAPDYTLDNTAPTWVSLVRQSPSGQNINASADPVVFRATFSEDLASPPGTSDFAVSGDVTGTITAVTAVTGTSVYDVTVGSLSGEGALGLTMAGPLSDAAGNSTANPSPTGTAETYERDVVAPRVASIERFDPTASPTNLDSVVWRITFNEAVSNLDVGDFEVSGTTGTLSYVRLFSNRIEVRLSGGDVTNGDITATLAFAAGQNITDQHGNALTNLTVTGTDERVWRIDNAAPVLTAFARNTPAGERTNADTLVFDISFSEAALNVSADDFEITGTTATGVLAGSGSAYTLTLSGGNLASYNGIVGLNLAAGQNITDAAGNALPAGEPATDQTYDVRNLAPALALITRSTPAGTPTNADSLVWDFAFSAIDGSFTLPANAFTVSGTTATVTDVSRYSIGLQVTVSGGDLATLNGDVTIGLANTDVADDYGNVMDRTIPAGAELTYTVDNSAPTVSISGASGFISGTFTATFTFSEDVAGFDLSDILLANGSATDLTGSGSVYSATITPAADGAVTVNVVAGRASDAAGNGNAAASPLVVTNDQTAPTVTVTGPAGPVTGAFTATVTFSEPVSGFTLGDISVGNGAASNLTGSDASYTATITPTAAGQVTVNVVSTQRPMLRAMAIPPRPSLPSSSTPRTGVSAPASRGWGQDG